MEGVSLTELLQKYKAKIYDGTIKAFVMDKDCSNSKIIREFFKDFTTLKIYYDPGHVKKSFTSQLRDLFGTRVDFTGIAGRMGRRFMRLIKEAEAKHPGNMPLMKVWFSTQMSAFLQHYTSLQCGKHCSQGSCKYREGQPSKGHEKGYKFLQTGLVAHQKKMIEVQEIVSKILSRQDEFIHGYNTCGGESIHNVRCMVAPKDKNFWKTFGGRCYYAIAKHLLGPECIGHIMKEFGVKMVSEKQQGGLDKWNEQHFARRVQQRSEDSRKQAARNKAAMLVRRETDKEEHPESRYFAPADKILIPLNEIAAGLFVDVAVPPKKTKASRKTYPQKLEQYNEEKSMEERKRKLWMCDMCGDIFNKASKLTHPDKCKQKLPTDNPSTAPPPTAVVTPPAPLLPTF